MPLSKRTELNLTNVRRKHLKDHLQNNYSTVFIKHKECFECIQEKYKLWNELSWHYPLSYLNNTVIRNLNNRKNKRYPMIICKENEIEYRTDVYRKFTCISYDEFLSLLGPLEIVEFNIINSSHEHIANQLRCDLGNKSLCLQLLQFYNYSKNSFEHGETYIYEIQRNIQTKRAIKN
jgi:hypothetical protein